jgi:CelD/BcsL family acetyltransferase involved in cellulose biosynthesis
MTALDLSDPRWLAFVTASASATPFHHPAWATLLSECYGFRASVLAMGEGDVMTGGMPVMEVKRPLGARRWVSLPFTDHCAPLVSEPQAEPFLAAATQQAERAGISQIEVHAPLEGFGIHSRAEGVIHTLHLSPDPEEVRRSFHKSQVIRSINRAEKEPIFVRRGQSAADLTEAFYGLHVRTRRKQGVPVQSRRFFELLWKHMLSRGLGFVLLTYSGTTPIAGAVFLTWNGTITYKYGASNPDYLQLRPNHLIFWEAIRWSCENGFHTFSFGRSDLDNKGLRDFKNGWGTTEEELRYSGIGGDPLGVPMEGMLGALAIVIRRSPLWVTRSLGEILYPFVA